MRAGLCGAAQKDARMWLRRELLFWSRLVRYHVSSMRVVRALDADRTRLRLLGQVALLALLVVGGYLIGRVSVPGCTPLAGPVCTEAQAQSPAAPTPAESGRQSVVVLADPALLRPSHFQPSAVPPSVAPAMPPLPEKKAADRVVVLTNDEIREMQAWLKAFGFDPGPIDGYPGARTTAAIKRYQAARQTEETGQMDRSLLRKVRREAGHS
jgi:hypothetical protein